MTSFFIRHYKLLQYRGIEGEVKRSKIMWNNIKSALLIKIYRTKQTDTYSVVLLLKNKGSLQELHHSNYGKTATSRPNTQNL